MDNWILNLPVPVALAAVALIGYLFGSRAHRGPDGQVTSSREMRRAKAVIRELETIGQKVRRELATHHSSVLRFKDRVSTVGGHENTAAWRDLCMEAEAMLGPTMRLATQIAHAYDEIRQQTNSLMAFSENRTDPLTGLSNRRALDESLKMLLAMMNRYGKVFSVIILDIDHFKQINDEMGHLHGDQILQSIANLFETQARETDLVTRYGGEEFVFVLPETDPEGAGVFASRLCGIVGQQLPVTVSCGVATVLDGDVAKSLLARADSALYSAKSDGRNCVFQHDGTRLVRVASSIEEGLSAGKVGNATRCEIDGPEPEAELVPSGRAD